MTGVQLRSVSRPVRFEYRPPGQGVGDVEPWPGQYDAVGHGSQVIELYAGWYFPLAHNEHVPIPSSLAKVPGLHMVGWVALVVHEWPRGQVVQFFSEVSPVLLLYVPALQGSGALLPRVQ